MKRIFALVLALLMLTSACSFVCAAGDRTVADKLEYVLAEGDNLYVESMIFNDDVLISGDNAQIFFANCIFNGDIINTAGVYTRVLLGEDNIVNGCCVIANDLTEGHLIETAFPKYISYVPVNVVCEGCYGAAIGVGDIEIVFNGQAYSTGDAGLFFDHSAPEAGFVPYAGQDSTMFTIVQWWELGNRILLVECENDPNV